VIAWRYDQAFSVLDQMPVDARAWERALPQRMRLSIAFWLDLDISDPPMV
jgi:hypothetical protein